MQIDCKSSYSFFSCNRQTPESVNTGMLFPFGILQHSGLVILALNLQLFVVALSSNPASRDRWLDLFLNSTVTFLVKSQLVGSCKLSFGIVLSFVYIKSYFI